VTRDSPNAPRTDVNIKRLLSWVEGQTRRGASSWLNSAARPHATTKLLPSYLLLEMSDFAINTIVMLIAKAMAASLICQRGKPKLLWAYEGKQRGQRDRTNRCRKQTKKRRSFHLPIMHGTSLNPRPTLSLTLEMDGRIAMSGRLAMLVQNAF
jgi:hypothetical protein